MPIGGYEVRSALNPAMVSAWWPSCSSVSSSPSGDRRASNGWGGWYPTCHLAGRMWQAPAECVRSLQCPAFARPDQGMEFYNPNSEHPPHFGRLCRTDASSQIFRVGIEVRIVLFHIVLRGVETWTVSKYSRRTGAYSSMIFQRSRYGFPLQVFGSSPAPFGYYIPVLLETSLLGFPLPGVVQFHHARRRKG